MRLFIFVHPPGEIRAKSATGHYRCCYIQHQAQQYETWGGKPPINSKVKKSIPLVNKYFPEENRELWLTASELHDRLVHCGVYPVLTVDIVNNISKLAIQC